MHHRAVTAGAGDQVAVQPLAGAGDFVRLDVDGCHAGTGHVLTATGLDHGAAGEDANAFGASFFNQSPAWVVARIGHRNNGEARIEPIQRNAVGMIVVGRQQQLFTRCHAVATHVGRHRTREHIARHIVVAIHQRTLARTGGQHHTLGTHTVDTLTHHANRRTITEMVGETLVNGQEVMVVVTVDGGAGQQHHVRQGFQFGNDAGNPFSGRLAVEAFARIEQRTTELFLLVGDDHTGTAARSGQRSREARRACAHDQHVAMTVEVVIGVRVVLGGRPAKACRLADVLLVGHPERLRVHEGFVVEARRHQLAADLAENAHHVVVHARPAVGAGSNQALVQRLLGGAHVGDLRGFGGADLQHRVRLFGACGKDAPWARVLEAAANDVDAVGQQGCGQGVAFKALVALTVERKRQDFITVDAATVGQAIDLAHTFSPEALAVN